MRLDMGGIWLWTDEPQQLRLAVAIGLPEAFRQQSAVLAPEDGITGHAAISGQTLVIEDLREASASGSALAVQAGIQGMVAVPIRLRNRVLGVFNVMTRQHRAFMPDELVLLTSIGQQIGIAVDSLRLLEEVRGQAEYVAALQERERIGIELHDGLLQTLSYLFMQTDQLVDRTAEAGLTDYARQLAVHRDVLEQAAQEARQFVAELRDSPPPPKPLRAALADMIAAFRQEYMLDVILHTDGPDLILDANVATQLVKIAREALTNAARHSQGRKAMVTCSVRGDFASLSVRDDGVGFDVGCLPDDGRPHFGLSIMQARAARIQGALQVDSSPGQGTCVCVTWVVTETERHGNHTRTGRG